MVGPEAASLVGADGADEEEAEEKGQLIVSGDQRRWGWSRGRGVLRVYAAGSTWTLCGLETGRDRLQTKAPGPLVLGVCWGLPALLLGTWQRHCSVFSALKRQHSKVFMHSAFL